MFNSFSAALAALKAHSSAVDTIGHNLANVNTTGFKAVEVAFKDLVAESMGGGPATGMGVGKPIMVRNFTQGAIQGTSGALNAAIQGNGFFVVNDAARSRTVYARWQLPGGQDRCHSDADGEKVQGYKVAADGAVAASLSDIVIPAGASAARATTNMSVFANLNANAAPGISSPRRSKWSIRWDRPTS